MNIRVLKVLLTVFAGFQLLFINTQLLIAQNNGLSFDGNGDFISIPDNPVVKLENKDFTLSFWMTLADINRVHDGLFGRDDFQWLAMEYNHDGDRRLNLWIDTNGSYYWELNNLKPLKNDWLPNTWYNIAIERISNTIKLFIDGVEVASQSFTGSIFNPADIPLYFGRSQLASRNHKGSLDDIRLWSYALSAAELNSSLKNELTGQEAGLAAYWKLNETGGLIVYDATANNNNGSLNGDASFINSSAPVSLASPANAPFSPVHSTGLPYNIILKNITIDGNSLPIGSQVGVFDGSQCVGAAVYSSVGNLQVVAWKGDPSQGLEGFINGHTISFKVRATWFSEVKMFNASSVFSTGDGTFGNGMYAVADLGVSTGFASKISISENALNFNALSVNTSATKKLIISNNGNAILNIADISANSTNFTTSKKTLVIKPGSSDTLDVIFNPTLVQDYNNTLTITSDAPGMLSLVVSLHGTGLPAPLPNIGIYPAKLDFGGAQVGSGALSKINILNNGNGLLNITNIVSSSTVFKVESAISFSLSQNQNKDISIRFAPSAKGIYNGTITVYSNSGNVTIPVYGIASDGHFVSIPATGLPYNIVVPNVDIEGKTIQSGDEIAVFDDTLCVGSNTVVKSGKSLDLDGSGSYVTLPANKWFVGDFTFEAWVKFRSFNNWSRIFDFGNGAASNNILASSYGTSGRVYLEVYNNSSAGGGILTPNALPLNEWTHIACVLKGNTGYIYINGLLAVSGTTAVPMDIIRSNNYIGHSNWGDPDANTFIDEVRIWNYGRSQVEITGTMNKSLNGSESGLVGYWNFETGVVKDNSVYGRNGSLIGNARCANDGAVPGTILLTTWQKDAALSLKGFTPGNPMSFKIWTSLFGSPVERKAIPAYLIGNGTFGFGQFTTVNLSASLKATPKIRLSTNYIYVGQIQVNKTISDTFYIANKGEAKLQVNLVQTSSSFSLNSSGGTINPNDSLLVIVTFKPTKSGSQISTIEVHSDDTVNPSLNIRIEGFAQPIGAAGIDMSTNVLNFNGVKIGTPKELTFNVVNAGTAPLVVSNIVSSNPQFKVAPTSFTIKNTNEIQEIKVILTPTVKGLITGNITITSNVPAKQLTAKGVGFDGHFDAVPATGLPYNIVITKTNISKYLKVGDEIAVFDGATCVGTSAVERDSSNIQVVAWKKDESRGYAGYTDGNTMSFKVWSKINSINSEFMAAPTYSVGDGTFGFGQFSVATLDFSTPDIKILPSDLFAAVKIPDSLKQVLSITNQGSAPLYFEIKTKPTDTWLQVKTLSGTLQPLESFNDTLIYKSANLVDGKYQTELTIVNNTPGKSPITVPVLLNVTGKQQIAATPTSLDFKEVEVGVVDTLTVQVQNIGTATLSVNSIDVANTVTTGFYLEKALSFPLSIEPMEVKKINICFKPTSIGVKTDEIKIISNASNEDTLKIPLTGKGQTPPHISVRPASLILKLYSGVMKVDSFYISNKGQGKLNFTLNKLVPWLLVQPLLGTVNAGDSTKVYVNISTNGMSTGTYNAIVQISSNDTQNPTINLPVSLSVKGNKIIVASGILQFGDVVVNSTSKLWLKITNGGSDALNVDSVKNTSNAFKMTGKTAFSINPGKADSIEVAFTPFNINSFSDILTLYSNAENSSELQVALQGKGSLPPAISLSDDTVKTTVISGNSRLISLGVTNLGNEALNYTTSLVNAARKSLWLDGNGDYVNILNSAELNPENALTIEAWINPEDNNNEYIVAKEITAPGPYRLFIESTGKLKFTVNGSYSITSKASVSLNQWLHIAAVFNGSFLQLYFNGVKDNEIVIPKTKLTVTTDNLRIGRSYQNEYFKGQIEEVRIWNIARSESEIYSAIQQSLVVTEKGLVLYYKFDDDKGNIIKDISLHNNNGTLYGDAKCVNSSLVIDNFVSLSNTIGNLGAGQYASIDILVKSGKQFANVYNREINIKSNDPKKSNLIVPLKITIDGNGVISTSSNTLNFKNTFVGYTDTLELSLLNNGAKELTITKWNINNTNFKVLDSIGSISPFASTKTRILFKPTVIGNIEEALVIENNSTVEPQYNITLKGQGVEPPVFKTSIANLQYGTVPVGIKVDSIIKISNDGISPLSIKEIKLNGSGVYTLSDNTPFTLNKGESRNLTLKFAPKAYVNYNTALVFSTNIGIITIPVSGKGTNASFDVSLARIISPTDGCNLGNKIPVKLRIKNVGSKAVSGFDLAYSIDEHSTVVENIGAVGISSGDSLDFTFTKPADLSLLGNHTIRCFVSMIGDPNSSNDTLNITTNNYSTLRIKISSDASICKGENIAVKATGANEYSWSNGATTSSILVSPVVSSTYKVFAKDAFGCSATDSVRVTVYPLPPVPFIVTSDPAHICEGDSLLLRTNIIVSGDSVSKKDIIKKGLSYSWLYDTQNWKGYQLINYATDSTYKAFWNTNYEVRVTNSFGCSLTSAPQFVEATPKPQVTSPLVVNVCNSIASDPIVLKSNVASTIFSWTATAPSSITGYTFSGTGNIPSQAASITSDYADTIKYFIQTSAKGCPGQNAVLNVIVNPIVEPDLATNLLPDHANNLLYPLELSWSPAKNVDRYDLNIWEDGTAPKIYLADTKSINIQIASGLKYGTLYNWTVTSKSVCSSSSTPINTFKLRYLPDLIVENVQASTNGFSGQQVAVNWQVKNNGKGETYGARWNDIVYLSVDSTLDIGIDYELGSVANLSSLMPNQSYKQSATVTLPNGINGKYYIIIYSDRYSQLLETNKTNNISSPTLIQVTLTPPPDLQVNSIISPLNAFSGQEINVTWEVKNHGLGGTRVNSWTDALFLTKDAALNIANAIKLGEFVHTGNLSADSSYTTTKAMNLPATILGNYYVFVSTDYYNKVYEHASESNNTERSEPMEVILTPPADLVLTDISAPGAVSSNENVWVKWTVENQGIADANGKWTDKVYISATNILDITKAQLLGNKTHSKLKSSDSYLDSLNVTIPKNITGNYYLFAVTDADKNVFEYDMENNNALMSAIDVQVPDLLLKQITCPANAKSGDSISIEWVIQNNGPGDLTGQLRKDSIYLSLNPVYNSSQLVRLGGISTTEVILSGKSVIKTAKFRLPDGATGNFYVYMITDAANSIFENESEANNTLRSKTFIGVTLSPWVNLKPVSIEIPLISQAGDDINISYKVKNLGNKVAMGYWSDNIYISKDASFNLKTAQFLFENKVGTLVDIDSTYNVDNLTLTLPNGLAPDFYYIYIVTDALNSIYEYNYEDDNVLISRIMEVKTYPPTDISAVSISAVNTTNSGQELSVQALVTNVGTPPSKASFWYDDIYISQTSVLDKNKAKLLKRISHNSSLKPQESYSVNEIVKIPDGLSGNYFLYFVADATETNGDINPANNQVSQPITIKLTPPVDLNVLSFSTAIEQFAGQPVQVFYEAINQGTNGTKRSWVDKVYLSNDNQISNDDVVIGSKEQTRTLAPDDSYTDSIQVFLPNNISGYKVIILSINANNDIYEPNYINNKSTSTILVKKALPCDLFVSNIDLPANALVGADLTVSWLLNNKGANPASGYIKEAVYLSQDTTWDVSDKLFGTLENTINVVPQSSVTHSLSNKLQNVPVGYHYAIVFTDMLNNFLESNEVNNKAASDKKVNVQVTDLAINDTINISVTNNTDVYYKIDVPSNMAGESVLLAIKGDTVYGNNQMYVKYGDMPSVAVYDYAAINPFQGTQQIIIPSLQAGSYYITIKGDTYSGTSQKMRISATILNFEILSINHNIGGNDGKITSLVVGSKFTDRMKMFLEGNGQKYVADTVIYLDPTRVYVTFNLTGAKEGVYNVAANNFCSGYAILKDGFTIEQYLPEDLQLNIVQPSSVAAGAIVPITIEFFNGGNTDIVNPVLEVVSAKTALSFTVKGLNDKKSTLLIPLGEQNNYINVLRPGYRGSVVIYTKATDGLGLFVRIIKPEEE
jgi:hypothetical protein